MTTSKPIRLRFVTCASKVAVLTQHLLASPCLGPNGHPLAVYFNASSAGAGFNAALATAPNPDSATTWLVWVHQDVFLPDGWDQRFAQALIDATQQFPKLSVAGVYGIAGAGATARRAGHVLDRGTRLRESAALPCLVDSLDELLFAVRVDSGLTIDPALGFDFYATDIVLQAQAQGLQCAVVDAYCEHWSDTPASGPVAQSVVQRIQASAMVFEHKWAPRLPITTSCFTIERAGDVAAFIAAVMTVTATDHQR